MKRSIILAMTLVLFSGCMPEPTPTPQKACMSSAQLSSYSYDYLSRVAKMLREDKKNIDTFEGFITAMKVTVDNYADMIKSSVYISNVVRFLPIPYAGEVSNTTKLISKTALHLNVAAVALDRYKKSSATFLDRFDKLNRTTAQPEDLAKLATYADSELLSDARDLQIALQKISSSTATMAATTQGISDALDTTGNYVNQAKSYVGFQASAVSTSDKTKVSENRNSINAKMGQLNQKIASLENSADMHRLNIEKAHIYADLAVQLNQ
ncbi:MAG: hypothetical protein PHO27_07565 [Sulfuricurvum sp.]|nr:hypothetical protein [Sulfuricurvum sp.]